MNFNLDVAKHITYTTEVKNLFESTDKSEFENESKKELVVSLLDWAKIKIKK